MGKKKNKYTNNFKAEVGLEAIKEHETIGQLSSKYSVHPTQIRRWRDDIQAGLPDLFNKDRDGELEEKDKLIDQLYHQVGQLSTELTWLKKKVKPFT